MREASGASNACGPKLPGDAMRVARRSPPTRILHSKPRDALGRRAAEGVPDSQSASEQGGSAKREKPCEQGWRHLVVN